MMNLGGLNPQKMLQKMQEDIERVQKELEGERLETKAAGGKMTVVTSGMGEMLEIKIAPEAVDPNDIETLQDLIVTGVRAAMTKATDHREQRMNQVVSIPKIPGLF